MATLSEGDYRGPELFSKPALILAVGKFLVK
jgi:hypothetical protein